MPESKSFGDLRASTPGRPKSSPKRQEVESPDCLVGMNIEEETDGEVRYNLFVEPTHDFSWESSEKSNAIALPHDKNSKEIKVMVGKLEDKPSTTIDSKDKTQLSARKQRNITKKNNDKQINNAKLKKESDVNSNKVSDANVNFNKEKKKESLETNRNIDCESRLKEIKSIVNSSKNYKE